MIILYAVVMEFELLTYLLTVEDEVNTWSNSHKKCQRRNIGTVETSWLRRQFTCH